MRSFRFVGSAALCGAAALALPAMGAAQRPQLERNPPPAAAMVCAPATQPETPAPVDSTARAEAEQLTLSATQAMLLGDLTAAAEFLGRALEANPGAPEAIYLRGRIAREQGDAVTAAPWFCRYLGLAPSGPSAAEARRRLEEAAAAGAGKEMYATFSAALAAYDAGRPDQADAQLSALIAQRPQLAEAYYDRGLVRAEAGRTVAARSDLARYLELTPDAADRAAVQQLVMRLAASRHAPAPGSAFLLGAVVPGGGQYYTGRPLLGLAVTGSAAGALAAGLLRKRTVIRCLDAASSGECPPSAVASRETDRPLLTAGIAVAAGLTLVAALEAARHAGRERDGNTAVPISADPPRVQVDPGSGAAPPALHLSLLRLRF